MTTSRLLAGASGYSFKEWKGTFYPGGHQAGGDAAPGIPRACRRSRSTTRSTGCRRPRCSRTGRPATPERLPVLDQGVAADHAHARLKVESAAEPLGYLYRNLAALGEKRGPVLFQLPPNLKKDLPRLTAFPRPAARGSSRRVRISQRHVVRRRRLRRAQRRRRGAVPVRARGQRAAAAGRDGAVGLRPAAARNLLGRRPAAVGAQARGHVVARDLRVLHARADGAPAYARKLMDLGTQAQNDERDAAAGHDRRRRDAERFPRPAANAAGCARLLRDGARRGRGHGASVHGELRERSRGARHRHASLSVSVHGARLEAPRSARGRARDRTRRGRGGIAPRCPGLRCSPAANPLAAA